MKTFKNILLQFTQKGMGSGDNELGMLLVKNYLTLLNEEEVLPKVIVFYNEGVKLICADSPVVEQLQLLEMRGVKLLACKTCLNHFNLLERMEVGIAGTMIDIIELQKAAEKVVSL